MEQLASVQGIQWKLTRTPLFILLGIVVFLQGAVIYLPGSFLPAFGLDAGLGPWQQALLLSGLNIATIPGQALFGWLAFVLCPYSMYIADLFPEMFAVHIFLYYWVVF